MKDFGGKVAVITGGASGIGRALAARFGAEGMHLMLADIEVDALADTARDLRSTGCQVESMATDVSDPGQVEALAARTVERYGAVHLLCNNAGVVTMGPVWEQPLEDWRWVLGVNLWGVIHGIRTFVPIMLTQGDAAHVVNTASIAGLVPSPTIGPYNVSKAGVVALSETLDMELRQAGAAIGVSVLCPGVVPTRIAASGRNRPGGDEAPLDIPTQDTLPDTALSPEQVADRVLDAVVAEEFWIVTHEGSTQLITQRADGMALGERPMPPPVF